MGLSSSLGRKNALIGLVLALGSLCVAAADPSLNVVLGRPTDSSVTLNCLSEKPLQIRAEYGTETASLNQKSPMLSLQPAVPSELSLTGLKPNTRYHYRLSQTDGSKVAEGTFHTQRAPGSAFTFALQGDSHPERAGRMFDAALYRRTMDLAASTQPDFYITMGDDFSIDPLLSRGSLSQESVNEVYARQRPFLGIIGKSAPLFLVNGNHEQAAMANLDGTATNCAILAGRARTNFFSLPAPDSFYSGNAKEVEHLGLPRDYYAWTWGDALFVVLDFYWHSPSYVDNEPGTRGGEKEKGKKGGKNKGGRDGWAVTLGDEQYHWLSKTLSESKARWKFVFCHHVLGGGRGGMERAPFFEWGGQDRHGANRFTEKRPGWELPIHPLMVKHGVTIFFQGHDHIFAHQELDGVIYQSCPNPADPTYTAFNREAYQSGTMLPCSGVMQVKVSPDKVEVDYLRSWLPADEKEGRRQGEVAHHYSIPAKPSP
ncbi:MAG: hypothetical protein RLZZ112_639 [Verrucomicrobiota bacterium]